MTVFGDGKQARCFTHVSDSVRALIGLLEKPSAFGEVFNIGGTTEISIADLAKKIRVLCGSRSEIVYVPYEKAYEEGFEDMPRRVPDIAKIGALLDWRPFISMDQILTDVIAFCRRG